MKFLQLFSSSIKGINRNNVQVLLISNRYYASQNERVGKVSMPNDKPLNMRMPCFQ
eukprot:Pgem_evm1s2823